jgi:hypothetical protein
MIGLYSDLLPAIIKVARENRRVTLYVTILAAILAVIGGILYYSRSNLPERWSSLGTSVALVLIWGGISVTAIGLLAIAPIDILGVEDELKPLRQEREEIQQRIDQETQPDITDNILLNLNQINEYYTINKSQARSSFRSSVFAIIVGLLTIIGGVWIYYLQPESNVQLAAVSTMGGLLAEFIGAAYFVLYNKTMDQANRLHDRLVKMQETMLAINLCGQLEEGPSRHDAIKQVITALLTRDAPSTT